MIPEGKKVSNDLKWLNQCILTSQYLQNYYTFADLTDVKKNVKKMFQEH